MHAAQPQKPADPKLTERRMAESEGFEPSTPRGVPPFQGGALDHYANSP